MAEYPSLPLWTDAYLGDTMHLKLEEHGAYLKLLIIAWRTPECCLPDDDAKIARMLGVTVDRWRDKLRPAIEPFWTVAEGRWTQKRLLKEREKVQNFSEVQRERARKRWPAKSLNGQGSGDAGAEPARGNAKPSPSPKISKKDSSPPAASLTPREEPCEQPAPLRGSIPDQLCKALEPLNVPPGHVMELYAGWCALMGVAWVNLKAAEALRKRNVADPLAWIGGAVMRAHRELNAATPPERGLSMAEADAEARRLYPHLFVETHQ